MIRNRNKVFLIAIAVMIGILALCLASCKSDSGKTSEPDIPIITDKILTEKETLDLLEDVSIPNNFTTTMRTEIGSGAYEKMGRFYHQADLEPVLMQEIYWGANDIQRTFYGMRGMDHVVVEEKTNEEGTTNKFRYLTDYEYLSEYNRIHDELTAYAFLEEFTTSPDSKPTAITGKKFADGNYEVTFSVGLPGEIAPMTVDVKMELDNQKQPKKYYLNIKFLAEYVPDMYDANILETFTVDFSQDYIALPQNIGSEEKAVSVSLEPYGDTAKFPETFNNIVGGGSEVILPSPEDIGITFSGWFYDEDLLYPIKDNVLQVSAKINDNMRIFPKWDIGVPQLILNGGTLDANAEKYLERAWRVRDMQYVRPSIANAKFVGWYKSADFNENSKITSNDDQFVTGSLKLYAKYTPLITIQFVAEGISYKLTPRIAAPGTYIPTPPAVKRGSVFVGWYLDAQFTQPAPEEVPDTDSTFYAKFEDGITMNINVYDGYVYDIFNAVPKYLSIPTNGNIEGLIDELSSYMNNVVLSGQVFDGWYLDSTFNTKWTQYPTADTTIYARFAPPYYMNVQLNGGSVTNGNLQFDGREISSVPVQQMKNESFERFVESLERQITPPVAQKFLGLFVDVACKVPLTDFPNTAMTVYVGYQDLDCVFFHLNGGMSTELTGMNYVLTQENSYAWTPGEWLKNYNLVEKLNSAIEYADSSKFFIGWYTDVALTQKYDYTAEWTKGKLNLYAKYETKKTITLEMGTGFDGYSSVLPVSNQEFMFAEAYANLTYSEFIENALPAAVASSQGTVEGFYTDSACLNRYVPSAEFEEITLYVKYIPYAQN